MGAFISKLLGSRLFSIGASVSLLLLGALYAYALLDNRHLNRVNAELESKINHPVTGYVHRLETAKTSAATLQTSIERQNAAFTAQSRAAAEQLADTRRQLVEAKKATKRAEAKAAVLLATPPKGNTLEERIEDIDARIMESL
jgi:hypothetical protein